MMIRVKIRYFIQYKYGRLMFLSWTILSVPCRQLMMKNKNII